jgi:hypothetical protein
MSSPAGSYVLGALMSIKAPTGSNNKVVNGERQDDHAQCGTGTWDYKVGLGLAKVTNTYSGYTSLYYQLNGTNGFSFHYGNNFQFNVGAEYRPGLDFAVTGEINGRYARRDEEGREFLPNTGGLVWYFSPGILYNVLPVIGIIANVQLPLIQNLNEKQDEGEVFTLAFRYDLL